MQANITSGMIFLPSCCSKLLLFFMTKIRSFVNNCYTAHAMTMVVQSDHTWAFKLKQADTSTPLKHYTSSLYDCFPKPLKPDDKSIPFCVPRNKVYWFGQHNLNAVRIFMRCLVCLNFTTICFCTSDVTEGLRWELKKYSPPKFLLNELLSLSSTEQINDKDL